jgi:hypothetical protein
MDMKTELDNAWESAKADIAAKLQSKHDAEVTDAREQGRLAGIAEAGGEIPAPTGMTQEQVDAIVAEKTAPLQARIDQLVQEDVLEDAEAAAFKDEVRKAAETLYKLVPGQPAPSQDGPTQEPEVTL